MSLNVARRSILRCALVLAVLGAVSVGAWPHPRAEAVDAIAVSGRLSGRAFPASGEKPTRLSTDQRVTLDVKIANHGPQPIEVDSIILRGRVISLTFFSVETSVAIAVPPGATVDRQFSLKLASLKVQAVGLFRSNVVLLDEKQRTLASEPMAVDVRGSWRSVYALFGYALALATLTAFARAVLDLSRHRLSPNRWRRGVRFFVPGLGLGLTGVFLLSALRIFLPGPVAWVPILVISSACGLVAGYLTPAPGEHLPSSEMSYEVPPTPSTTEGPQEMPGRIE